MKKTTFLAFLLSAFGLLSATAQNTDFYDGIFVLNEGGFMAGNASLSFFNPDGDFENDVYNTVNNDTLGDTAQHMAFNNDRAYIVLNGSNEIVIAQAGSLEYIATVSDTANLKNPRYIGFYENKAYITCWGEFGSDTDDYVAVMNVDDNTFITKIPVGEGPEKILIQGNRIFVAMKGVLDQGNTVTVINAEDDTVLETLTVGRVPGSMAIQNNILYVLCEGRPAWTNNETSGSLYKYNIEGSTITLSSSTIFPGIQHPSNIQVNGTDIYWTMNDGIYHTTPNQPTLPTAPLFTIPSLPGVPVEPEEGEEPVEPQPIPRIIYGFNIIDDLLYVGSYVVNFNNPGEIFIYSAEGEMLDQQTTGIGPNGFYKAPSEPLAVNSNTLAEVTVYPNPATSVIYISIAKPAAVKLYDVTGRVVKAENYTMAGINLTGLSKGNYFMEITSENAKTVKQIVIK